MVLYTSSMDTHAQMYKWQDDQGNTVYSQHLPSDERNTTPMKPAAPPASADLGHERLRSRTQSLDDAREDRSIRAQEQAHIRETQRARHDNCLRARDNLAILQQGSQQLIKDSGGDYRRLTVEEREAGIRKHQAVIDRDCGR